jgi:hypothetical protein
MCQGMCTIHVFCHETRQIYIASPSPYGEPIILIPPGIPHGVIRPQLALECVCRRGR